MSATSTSTDPVTTVVDLLSGTPVGDWPGGVKPSPIETQWEHDFTWKSNQNGPAAYVWSPARGTREPLSADWKIADQEETIDIDVWAPDEADANTVAGDVLAILEDYANDKQANTEWDRIRPARETVDDRRAETLARRAGQHVVSVQVTLRREDSIGT